MSIDALGSVTGNTAVNDRNSLSSNFDMFLRLLTTQLQNQDPLEPTDTNQFTQQLVQYSQVEQQIKSNDNLTKLVGLQSNLQLQSALGYIGMDVRAPLNIFNHTSGEYTFDYALPENAQTCKVSILNDKGDVVYTANGALEGNKLHQFTWDGKNTDGEVMPAGTYTIRVAASNATGKAMDAETAVWGQVTGMETVDGETKLKIGKIYVSLDQVMAAQMHQSSN